MVRPICFTIAVCHSGLSLPSFYCFFGLVSSPGLCNIVQKRLCGLGFCACVSEREERSLTVTDLGPTSAMH